MIWSNDIWVFEKKASKSPIALCHVHNVVGFLWICSFNFVSVLSVGMPSIRPLETLHNSLSLRQLDAFLEYVTATIFKTPCPSPRLRSPLRSNPFVFLATCNKGPSINDIGNWEGRVQNLVKKANGWYKKKLPTWVIADVVYLIMDGHQYGSTIKRSFDNFYCVCFF